MEKFKPSKTVEKAGALVINWRMCIGASESEVVKSNTNACFYSRSRELCARRQTSARHHTFSNIFLWLWFSCHYLERSRKLRASEGRSGCASDEEGAKLQGYGCMMCMNGCAILFSQQPISAHSFLIYY